MNIDYRSRFKLTKAFVDWQSVRWQSAWLLLKPCSWATINHMGWWSNLAFCPKFKSSTNGVAVISKISQNMRLSTNRLWFPRMTFGFTWMAFNATHRIWITHTILTIECRRMLLACRSIDKRLHWYDRVAIVIDFTQSEETNKRIKNPATESLTNERASRYWKVNAPIRQKIGNYHNIADFWTKFLSNSLESRKHKNRSNTKNKC